MKIPKIKLLIYFLLFTVLAAIIIMITVESFGGGKIVVNNKTKHAIESLEVSTARPYIDAVRALFKRRAAKHR